MKEVQQATKRIPAAALPAAADSSEDAVTFGMIAGLGGFFMLSAMNMFAKLLSDMHSVLEIAFYRNAIAILPFLGVILLFGRRDILIVKSKPWALISRSFIGTFALLSTFGAYSYLPMADAATFMFTSSLFIPLIGAILLRERVGLHRGGAIVAGFAGVAVMAQPSGVLNGVGVGLALLAALIQAVMSVLLRLLGRTEQPETVTFYFLLVSVMLTAPAMLAVAKPVAMNEIGLLVGVGLSGAAAQTLFSVAFKYAPAAVVSVFNYSSIIWATAFGWLVWGQWPGLPVWIGAAIVISASFFILWREGALARRKHLTEQSRVG